MVHAVWGFRSFPDTRWSGVVIDYSASSQRPEEVNTVLTFSASAIALAPSSPILL